MMAPIFISTNTCVNLGNILCVQLDNCLIFHSYTDKVGSIFIL